MKKIFLLLVLFLNLLPAVRKGKIVFSGPITAMAQDDFGDEHEGGHGDPPGEPPAPTCTNTSFDTKVLETVQSVIEITETCSVTKVCGGSETGRECHYGARIKEGFPEPPEAELPGFPSEGTPEQPAPPGGSGNYPIYFYSMSSGGFSVTPSGYYAGTTDADKFHGTGTYSIGCNGTALQVHINMLIKLPDNYPLWANGFHQYVGTIVDNATGQVISNIGWNMYSPFPPPLVPLAYDKTMATIESHDFIEAPQVSNDPLAALTYWRSRNITVHLNFGMFNGDIGSISYFTFNGTVY